MSSGASGATPNASLTMSRAPSTSAWLAAITPRHPSGESVDMNWSATGNDSAALGSAVPVQSASARKSERPPSGAFAPCEMTSGRIPA